MKLLGYELCKLSESEFKELPTDVTFNYKEAQCYRALDWMGQLSIGEARFLGELVAGSDPTRPIIEIGTLFGFSTIVLSLFKKQEQRLITVDNFSWNPLGISPEMHFRATSNRLSHLVASHNVTMRRMDKEQFFSTYDGPPPGLFFCDADHSYQATSRDIAWAKSVGASIICGDDYDPIKHPGVTKAVDEHGGPRRLVEGLFLL